MTLQSGDLFEMAHETPWESATGPATHRLVLLCAVHTIDADSVSYEVGDILSETDPPPPDIRFVPDAGGIGAAAFDELVASGEIILR